MANTFQKAAFNRKLTYSVLIVAIFVVTLFGRGKFTLPGDLNKYTVKSQADRWKLSSDSRGGSELSGKAIQLVLTGSQGLVTCILWLKANDYQRNQEWNKLEVVVDSATKLQPYFLTPWLFQSWNLAYNVSVTMTRMNDMYFYIARGISLLAEGESINENSPDLRYNIGLYLQNKFTVSDKVNTLRCLYQLSCIPPDERKADLLLTPDRKAVNMQAFLEFCNKHPQLVRRLRESTVALSQPADIVNFLKENVKVPTRYRDGMNLEVSGYNQFPVLPPQFLNDEAEELTPKREIQDRDADALVAARAWYRYSMVPVPPPNNRPVHLATEEEKAKYRIPKSPMLVIFLQAAPRSQTYIAERLQKEGWIDNDPWKVDEFRDIGEPERWFTQDVAIPPSMTSQEAWEKAFRMWDEHGKGRGLFYDKATMANLVSRAREFAQHRGKAIEELGQQTEATPEELADPILRDRFEAYEDLRNFRLNASVTNFKSFLFCSEAEMDRDTLEARKIFFKAEQYKKMAKTSKAPALYVKAFELWKKVFLKNPYFHRGDEEAGGNEGDKQQEEVLEYEINYLDIITGPYLSKRREAVLALNDIMNGLGAAGTRDPLQVLGSVYLMNEAKLVSVSDRIEPLPQPGPLDGDDPNGRPWISPYIRERVKQRLAPTRQAAAQAAQSAPRPTPTTSSVGP